MNYKEIPGMMDYEDLYSDMVRACNNHSTFVELGSWYGRSAVYMCNEILKSGKDIKFYTIDWFLKSPLTVVKENLYEYDFAEVIKSETSDAARLFKDKTIDFCFIDADHSFNGVQHDIKAWLPKVRGYIAGHDYGNPRYPYLKDGVNELLNVKKTSKQCWIHQVG
jgi:cephalosporin hydroxylase